jgi:hypothetical protein
MMMMTEMMIIVITTATAVMQVAICGKLVVAELVRKFSNYMEPQGPKT